MMESLIGKLLIWREVQVRQMGLSRNLMHPPCKRSKTDFQISFNFYNLNYQGTRISQDSDSTPAVEEETASIPDKKRRIAHVTKLGFPAPKPNRKVIRPVVSSVGQVN
jgi:hypothetical protein